VFGSCLEWRDESLLSRPVRIEVPVNFVTASLSQSTPPEPMLEHAIQHRAYELYIERGMAQGHAIDDWLKAEAEIVRGHSTSDSNMPYLFT
jgi:hypothetical protein